MTPDVDLDTLRLLVAVERLGSLNQAAVELGVTQPAASKRIRQFEARWRLAVVERSARGSKLTTDGEAVAAWARDVLHTVDTMRASLAALSAERRTGLSVAASLTVAEHVLPRWLGELHAHQPGIAPMLNVVNSEQVLAQVRTGEVDLGFIESAGTPIDVAHKVVGRDRLAVVVAPDHPWARRVTPIRRPELERTRWVLREPGSGTRSTFEGQLRREPQVAMEGTSTAALVGAAVAGLGPAVVSARSVSSELDTGRLREVPTELDLFRPLTAVWRREQRLTDPAAELLRIAAHASTRS